jgi:hypothetical protein
MAQMNYDDSQSGSEFKEKLVAVNRVSKTVKGGKQFAFTALTVVGDGNGRVGVVANRRLRILVRLAHVGDDANGHLVQHLYRRLVDLEAERRLPQLFRELELHVLRVGGAAGTQRTRQVLDLDEEGDTVVLRLALHHVVEEHRLLRARKRARATAAAWWARRGRVRVAARRRRRRHMPG